MNVQQLEAFLEVASKRSFGKAARSLFITQPTLSARIKTLESELGQELFVRPKGGVRLTDRGTRFLPFAERAMDLLREGSRAVREAPVPSSGRLRIGATPSCSSYIVPRVLELFHERHPQVAVELTHGASADVLEMVLSRTVQLGFTRALQHPRLQLMDVFNEELIPVVRPSHKLARTQPVSMVEMAQFPNILFRNGSSYCGLVTSAYFQAEALPRVVMNLPSSDIIKEMVLAGIGVAFLPRGYIAEDLVNGTIVEVIPKETLNLSLRVVCSISRITRMTSW